MPRQVVKGIKRLNQFVDPELIGNDELSEFENMTLDQEPQLR